MRAARRVAYGGLRSLRRCGTLPGMSTITEIEAAIERLPVSQVAQLAAWLEEFRARPRAKTPAVYADLDSLIGTWHEDEDFDAAIRAFEQVDEALWK